MPRVKSNKGVVAKVSKAKKPAKKALMKRHLRPAHGILSEFPPRKYCRLEYVALDTLTSAVTQNNFGTEVVYLLGGLYQPRFTGTTGFRPQGYDQMIVPYTKWKVYGCKITLEFYNPSQDGLCVAAQMQSASESSTITGDKVSTFSMKKWAWAHYITNTGAQRIKYNRFAKNRAIEGMSKVQFEGDNSNYSGSVAGNPTLSPYLRIALANTKDTTAATVSCLVKLEFYVQFYDRNILPSST